MKTASIGDAEDNGSYFQECKSWENCQMLETPKFMDARER